MTTPDSIDLTDPGAYVDGVPHASFRALREKDPVSWQEEANGPGFWAVTRHADVVQVSKSPKIYSSALGATNVQSEIGQCTCRMGKCFVIFLGTARVSCAPINVLLLHNFAYAAKMNQSSRHFFRVQGCHRPLLARGCQHNACCVMHHHTVCRAHSMLQ